MSTYVLLKLLILLPDIFGICVAVGNFSVGANDVNATTNSSVVSYFSTDNASIVFFAHADWGKGGWDGSQHRKLDDGNANKYKDADLSDDKSELNGEQVEGRNEGNHEHREEVFYQGYTARAMTNVVNVTNSKPSFVLALGDNFYNDGVSSINDSMWYTHFRDVYFRSSALRGVPWHAALGNHDLGYGSIGVQAQINRTFAETSDDDGAWSMRGQWYSVRYAIPCAREDRNASVVDHSNSTAFVQVIVVDTTWLAPSENKATNEEGGISVETQASRIERQLLDLEAIFNETLTDRPTWLIVAGHYPIFSRGEKGDNEELDIFLRPLLEHFNVHAYLSGHDHIAEALEYGGIHYFVTGHSTMNNDLDEEVSSNATLLWAGQSTSGFTRFTATDWILHVEYVEANSSAVLYQHTLTNPLVSPLAVRDTSEADNNTDHTDDNGGGRENIDENLSEGLFTQIYDWYQSILLKITDSPKEANLVGCAMIFITSTVLSIVMTSLLKFSYSTPSKATWKRLNGPSNEEPSEDNLPLGPVSSILGSGFKMNGIKNLYQATIESSRRAQTLEGSYWFPFYKGLEDGHGLGAHFSNRMPVRKRGRWRSPTRRFSGVSYETIESLEETIMTK